MGEQRVSCFIKSNIDRVESAQARRRLPGLTRLTALVTAAVLLCVLTEPWPVFVPALSPLAALSVVLATWNWPVFAIPGLIMALVVCWQHRWFCHWVCPTGCCVDGASWMGRRCGRRAGRFPFLGQVLCCVVLAGASGGYPVLLWLDPLALLSAAAGSGHAQRFGAPSWGALGLLIILVFSLLWPHVWCTRLCPLGGLQDLLAPTIRRLVSNVGRWRRTKTTSRSGSGILLPRRAFLGGAAGWLWATCLVWWSPARPRPLRPPGAAEETRFSSLCLRCGNCLRVCPAGIIRADTGRYGIGGLLAPVLEFDTDYCWESCNRCTLVCPSGAIMPVQPEHKTQVVLGTPQVDMSICLLGRDRDCAICRNRCPYSAIHFVFDEREYTLTPQVNLQRCNGCGACQVACPTQPHKALVVGRASPEHRHVAQRSK